MTQGPVKAYLSGLSHLISARRSPRRRTKMTDRHHDYHEGTHKKHNFLWPRSEEEKEEEAMKKVLLLPLSVASSTVRLKQRERSRLIHIVDTFLLLACGLRTTSRNALLYHFFRCLHARRKAEIFFLSNSTFNSDQRFKKHFDGTEQQCKCVNYTYAPIIGLLLQYK